MLPPQGFSWIDKPYLAALARPDSADELTWLRAQGIQLLISLSEDPLPRHWINDAGMFAMHVPIVDMHPPSAKQIELTLSALDKARARKIGAGIHCTAGLGRTGTILACYFVQQGMSGPAAVARIRDLRPGSIETEEQVDSIMEFARSRK